jgi:putative DNA primase/helicase
MCLRISSRNTTSAGVPNRPRLDKGLAWLAGEIKRAREKPNRDNRSETPFGTARLDPDRPAIDPIAGSDKDPDGHLPSRAPSPSARKPVDRTHEEPEIDLEACGGNEPGPAVKGHDAKPDAALEIQRLARFSSLDCERERESAAQRLAIRVLVLDELVKQARAANEEGDSKGQGRPISFSEPEPWPHAVDGAALLNGLVAAPMRHVIMSKAAADATALWIAHTYLMEVFNTSPKLATTSPEKQCGKTTLLDILGIVTRCPLPTANATPAVIFRVIEKVRPTVLIDEGDTFLKDKGELLGILNSGQRRNTAYILRSVGDDHEPRKFSTWAAVAIAMIGRLPPTLEDRSIPVELRRRLPKEAIVPFKHDDANLRRLASMATRWSHDHADEIGRAIPAIPDGIYNRQADNWSPLFAIADTAGGKWPDRARLAAKALTTVAAGDDQSISITLLADIRNLFDGRPDGKITTKDLLAGLLAIEERSWSEWRRGKPISPPALAKLLAPFGIVPINLKLPEERVLKGYRREHFEDAFARYLPPPPIVAATPLLHPSDGHNLHVSRPLPGDGGSGCANRENPNGDAPSSGVAAVKAPNSSDNGASIPFMITRAMKDELRRRGLSDDQMENLTPQDAHDILSHPAGNQRGTV